MTSLEPNAYATPTSLSLPSPNKAPDSRQPVITIPDSGATTPTHIDLDANDVKSEFLTAESVHDISTAKQRGSPELAAIAGAENPNISRTGCQELPIDAQPNEIAYEKVSLGGHLRHDSSWPPSINGHVAEADLASEVIESRFAPGSSFDSSNAPRRSQPACSREMVKVVDPWSKRDGRLTRPTNTPKQPKKATLIGSEQQKRLSSIWDPIDSDTENSLEFKAQRRPNRRLTSSQLPLTSNNLASSQQRNSLSQGSGLRTSATNGSSTSSLERSQKVPGSGIPAALSQRGTPGSILFAESNHAEVPSSSQASRTMVGGEPKAVPSLSSVHQQIYTPPNSQGVIMSQASNLTNTIQTEGRFDLTYGKMNQSQAKYHEQEMFDVEKAEEDALLNESIRTEALSLSSSGKARELSEKGMLLRDVTTASIGSTRSGQASEKQQQYVEEGTSIKMTPIGLGNTEEALYQADETLVSREAEEEARLLWQEMQNREQEAAKEKAEKERAKEEQRLKAEKSQIDRKAKEKEEARKAILAKEQAKAQETKAKETKAKERKAKLEGKALAEKAKLEKRAKEEEKARMAEVAKQEAKVKAQKAMDEKKKAKAQEHAERQAQELAASIAAQQQKETTTGDSSKKRKSLFTQEGSVKATKSNPRTPQMSSDPITDQDRRRKSMTPAFPDSSGTKPPLSAQADAMSSEYNQSLMPQPNNQRNLPSALRQSPSILRRSVSFANDSVDTPETLAPSRLISRASISSTPSRALGSSPIRSISIDDKAANDKTNLWEPSSIANGKSSKAVKTYSTKKPSAKDKVQTKITQTVTRDVKLKGKMPQPAITASDKIVISSDSEKSVSSYYSESEGKPDVGNAKAGPSSRMKMRRKDTHSDEENEFGDEDVPILQTQTKPLLKANLQPTIVIPSKLASHTTSKGETGATPSSRSSRSPARYDVDKSASPESITSESGSQSDQDSEDSPETADRPSRSLPKSGLSNSIAISSSMSAKIDKTDAKAQEKTAKSRSSDSAMSSEASKSSSVKAKRSSPSGQTDGKRVENEVDQQLQREIRLSGELHRDKKPSLRATTNGGPLKAANKTPSTVKPISAMKPDPRAGGIQHFPSLTDIRSKPDIYKGWEPPPQDRRPEFMKMKRNGITEAAKVVNGSDDSSSESDDDSSDDDSGISGMDAGKGKGGKSLGRLLKRRCSLQ